MGWYGACAGGTSVWLWIVVAALGLVALTAIGASAVARLTGGESARVSPAETPRQALDRRLGAGRISVDEYLRARELLEDGQPRQERAAPGR